MKPTTFADRVLHFYDTLALPDTTPHGVEVLDPYSDPAVRQCMHSFYTTFYDDIKKRVFVFGINPGRFGAGVTGIPFTDPVALEDVCGIANDWEKRKELSSEFVYAFIEAFGGPRAFYEHFYITAVSPVGYTKDGVNYNYYDDATLYRGLRPFLLRTIHEQADFGSLRDHVVVFGSGKNLKIFTELNEELGLFTHVHPLEHPRYIMQYKRKERDEYIQRYIETFSALVS